MQDCPYRAEQAERKMGERRIMLLSLYPSLPPEERAKQKSCIEDTLYEVFSHYGKTNKAPSLMGAE